MCVYVCVCSACSRGRGEEEQGPKGTPPSLEITVLILSLARGFPHLHLGSCLPYHCLPSSARQRAEHTHSSAWWPRGPRLATDTSQLATPPSPTPRDGSAFPTAFPGDPSCREARNNPPSCLRISFWLSPQTGPESYSAPPLPPNIHTHQPPRNFLLHTLLGGMGVSRSKGHLSP